MSRGACKGAYAEGPTPEANAPVQSVYRDIHDGLREELVRSLGRNRFRLWFRDTSVVDVSEHALTLAVPNDVHRTWLQYTFGDALRSACEKVLGDGVEVRLQVSSEQEARRLLRERMPQRAEEWDVLLDARVPPYSLETFVAEATSGSAEQRSYAENGALARGSVSGEAASGEASATECSTPAAHRPLAPVGEHLPRLSARFPLMMLRQLLDAGTAEGAPSVCLHGPAGCGKTHLLKGLENDSARRRPGAALYMTARRFTQRYVTAVRAKEVDALRAFEVDLRSRAIVLLDDLDELDSRTATQQELVRLLDRCTGSGPRFVFGARRHPRDIPGLSPRLRSRLLGGLVLPLGVPDRALLGDILKRRAHSIGVRSFEGAGAVREAILDRTSSVRGAVELFDRWACASQVCGCGLEVDWLEELAPNVAATAREEVIRRAKELVADHFGVKRTLLDQPTKVRSARFPRRVAMYLVYRACALPLSELGSAFGLRSHSSVSRSIREMRTQRARDADVEQLVDGLLARL